METALTTQDQTEEQLALPELDPQAADTASDASSFASRGSRGPAGSLASHASNHVVTIVTQRTSHTQKLPKIFRAFDRSEGGLIQCHPAGPLLTRDRPHVSSK